MCLAREKGMKVVSIEVKYTMTAEALADQWIPIRPQTDMVMMLAVANVLFKENLYDQDYVSKFVEPTGFQKWQDYVLGVTGGPDGVIDRTPEWAAPICGVPAATIRAFAELYGTTKPAYLMFGLGAGRQSRAMNPARAAVYLQAMTGNIGVIGGSSGCIGLQFNDVDWTAFWPTVPGLFPLPGPPPTPDLFAEFKIADAILMRNDFDNGTITKDQYYLAIGNTQNNPAPNLKMLLIIGDNTPGSGHVNFPKMIQAYSAVEMFVNCKRHFDGAAKYADLVLPLTQIYEEAPSWQLNSRGFVYLPKIIEPPGEARDPDWIRTQIAIGLGVNANYYPRFQNTTWDDWASAWEQVRQEEYETWAAKPSTLAIYPNPPSWEDFLKQPVLRIGIQNPPNVQFSDQTQSGKPFGTNSGKIEFYDSSLETFDASKVKVMFYCGVGAPVAPMAIWENPEEGPLDPQVSKYPLWLGTGGHGRHPIFSMNWPNPMIYGEIARHSVWISIADAKARGINDGDLARVYNDRGEMVIPAYVTSRLSPGTVWMYPSMNMELDDEGIDRGGLGNILTNDNLTAAPTGQEPTNALVEVEKF
jgi:anaerobic dimethyl sulfoxide reductase subunit A